jgi:hypothetical protein
VRKDERVKFASKLRGTCSFGGADSFDVTNGAELVELVWQWLAECVYVVKHEKVGTGASPTAELRAAFCGSNRLLHL